MNSLELMYTGSDLLKEKKIPSHVLTQSYCYQKHWINREKNFN